MMIEGLNDRNYSKAIDIHFVGVTLCDPLLAMEVFIASYQYLHLPERINSEAKPISLCTCVLNASHHGSPVYLVE